MLRPLLLVLLTLLVVGCASSADGGGAAEAAQAQTQPPDADPGPTADPTPDPSPTSHATPTPDATPSPEATAAPSRVPDPGDEPCVDPPCYAAPVRIGAFDAELVPEASGLAVSRRDPSVLYVLDDRPGTSQVWAVHRDGEMLGAIGVQGLDAVDTESLAVGACGGPDGIGACVYVGDIGDNRRAREHITVHRFAEPDLVGGVPADPVPADRIQLRYPDGPHDAEALFVGADGALFIVTKARFDRDTGVTGPTHLYRAATFADGELEHLGVLEIPTPAQPLQSLFVGNVVTGAEAADGHVILRTYDQVLSLRGTDPATLPSWEMRAVPSPPELQSEAIALDADGCSYLTVGEMVGDIWYVECRP